MEETSLRIRDLNNSEHWTVDAKERNVYIYAQIDGMIYPLHRIEKSTGKIGPVEPGAPYFLALVHDHGEAMWVDYDVEPDFFLQAGDCIVPQGNLFPLTNYPEFWMTVKWIRKSAFFNVDEKYVVCVENKAGMQFTLHARETMLREMRIKL